MTSHSDSGFTLIEVLAALVVFSVAIVGLTHAGTQSLKTVSALQQKSLAGIVADNQLILSRDARLVVGRKTGKSVQMGLELEWALTTQTTEIEGLYLLNVEVKLENGEQILSQRTAYRQADET